MKLMNLKLKDFNMVWLDFDRRVPEFFPEINNPVVFNNDTLICEKLFHGCRITEMMFSCKKALMIHHSVCRYEIRPGMAGVQRPAYSSG